MTLKRNVNNMSFNKLMQANLHNINSYLDYFVYIANRLIYTSIPRDNLRVQESVR